MSLPHQAFTIDFNGLARELASEIEIYDPITKTSAHFEGIWDTGATNTAISNRLVTQLGLIATGKIPVTGVCGRKKVSYSKLIA